MKSLVILVFIISSLQAFTQGTEVINKHYELSKPDKIINAVLVLFGGFPEYASDIKQEFKIKEITKENNVAVVYMNFNRKLWLNEIDKTQTTKLLEIIFKDNKLPTDNIFIGGFSSGGNVTLLLTNYLKSTDSPIQPEGIFVVDSPVDLLELYRVSERNIKRSFSKDSIQEPIWLVNFFNSKIGNPENGIKEYEAFSPFTSQTNNTKNLTNLNGMKIRFYSEPDTIWWKKYRNNEPTDLNAFWIEKLATQLKSELSNSTIEYITTENKGYRANGERHPHSWSIIDKKNLIYWMINK